MEKMDVMMRALAVGTSAAHLYAGKHDVEISTSNASYGFGVTISLFPRDKNRELIHDKKEDGSEELRSHRFDFREWDSLDVLIKQFRAMNKFLNNPKAIGL